MRNYNSMGSREPIWTQVADPEDGLRNLVQEQLQRSAETNPVQKSLNEKGHGINTFTAAVFIAGEMAGSGVLALPRAIVDAGWIGIILLLVFCGLSAFGGTRLGECWGILEERYHEHRERTRNPYATIAHRAVGRWGSIVVSLCIQITLFGAGTVYLLLASQIFQELLSDIFPHINFCSWFLLIGLIITPAMWFGSPKDFWAVGIMATLTTAIACVLIFTQIVMDGLNKVTPVVHQVHNFHDFFMACGVLLFAFGGASTFPTIQNDMECKSKFTNSVTYAFSVIFILYFPVSAGGYFVYGDAVNMNIIKSLSKTVLVTAANILMAIHLILAFLIVINPVCQELEEFFKVPQRYHWKRCIVRTGMVIVMLLIGESIPQFGKILSLVGGSTITLLTFVFPPYFYMKLCSQKDPMWPQRHIPGYVKVILWELILIGIIGGSASTYTAIIDIFGENSMSKSCFWNFK